MSQAYTGTRLRSLFGVPIPRPGQGFVLALGVLYLALGAILAWRAMNGLAESTDGMPIGSLVVGAGAGLLIAMGIRVASHSRRILAETAHRQGLRAMRSGRFPESRRHFARAKSLVPSYWEAYYHLGLVASREKRPEAEVFAHFEAGLAVAPSEPTLLFALASIEDDLGRPAEAKARLHALLDTHPDHADAHCLLGYLEEQEGDSERAAIHYQRALEARPGHSTALRNRARLIDSRSKQPTLGDNELAG